MLWLAALAAAPAFGQSKAADPADPNATVPQTRYVSIPAARAAAPATTPAQNWKAANETVASYDSMSQTMEMAEPAAPGVPAAPAASTTPAAPTASTVPAAPAVPAPAPDAHAHHMNMNMEGK